MSFPFYYKNNLNLKFFKIMKFDNKFKVFFIKIISIFLLVIFAINYTYNLFISDSINILKKISNISDRQSREQLKNKIRKEIKYSIEKDRILSKEDAELFKILNKISKALVQSNYLKKNIIFILLCFYSFYCAIILGEFTDESFHSRYGELTFNYLLSGGITLEKHIWSEFFSKLYWTLQYFFTTLFPKKYSLEIAVCFNSIFSISAIIGFIKFFEICFFKNKSNI